MKTHALSWPRERSRLSSHYPQSDSIAWIIHRLFGGGFSHETHHSVESIVLPPSVEQTMFDIGGNDRSSFKDVCNRKVVRLYGGTTDNELGNVLNQPHFSWQNETIAGGYDTYYHPAGSFLRPAMNVCIPRNCHSLFGAENLAYILDSSDWVERMRQKQEKIRVSLNTGFDIVNFLIQWKDAQRIVTHYMTKTGWVERLRSFFNKRGQLTPGSIAANVANEHLEHQYGTLSFFRDSHQLFLILADWKKNADRLIAGAGIDHRFYQESETDPWGAHEQSWSFPVESRVNSTVRCRTSYSPGLTLRACMAYSYAVPEIKGILSRLAQLSDSLGLSLDASIVWNAIPFTFVVDWFLNVSETLHEERVDWVTCDVTVNDYCRSGSIKSNRIIEWISSDPLHPDVPEVQTLGYVETSYYKRERDVPYLDSHNVTLPDNHHWSYTRVCNATALVVQQVPSRTRKINAEWQHAVLRIRRVAESVNKDRAAFVREYKILKKKLARINKKSKRLALIAKWKVEKFNASIKRWNGRIIELKETRDNVWGLRFVTRRRRPSDLVVVSNLCFHPGNRRIERAIARLPHVGIY